MSVPSQYPTIQAAITAANTGDTVLVSNGTYVGAGNINLDFGGKAITVQSVSGPSGTTIDCQHNGVGFNFHRGEPPSARVDGFTIKNGYGSDGSGDVVGGVLINASSPVISNCVITANDGVGIEIASSSNATITNCTISGNTGSKEGGGVRINDAGADITGCTFASNNAMFDGGGMYASIDAYAIGNPVIVISNCNFINNRATNAYGGGLFLAGGSSGVTNCTFSGNTAGDGGGGLFLQDGPRAVTNCTFSGNTAETGGAVCVFGGSSKPTNCTFYHDSSVYGSDEIYAGSGPIYQTSVAATNCIFYGDIPGKQFATDGQGASSVTVTYSDVQGGYAGSGNINVNPAFINAPTDLHITSGSPCRGAGTAVGAPATDQDGYGRPNPPSIGAYEFATHSWSATSLSEGEDGYSRLLWDNLNGMAAFWLLDPTEHYVSQTQYGPFSGWAAQAVSTGRDLKTRVLWTNTSGQAAFWRLDANNNYLDQQQYGPFSGYTATALSTGPDGYTRVLWDTANGAAAVWLLDPSNHLVSQTQYGPFAGWAAKSVSTGPDLRTRVLWVNGGTAAFWRLDANNNYLDQQNYGPFPGWSATSLSAGADGYARAVWSYTDGTAAFWLLDPQNRFVSQQQYGPFAGWSAQSLVGGAPDASSRALWANVSGQVALWGVDPTNNALGQQQYGPF